MVATQVGRNKMAYGLRRVKTKQTRVTHVLACIYCVAAGGLCRSSINSVSTLLHTKWDVPRTSLSQSQEKMRSSNELWAGSAETPPPSSSVLKVRMEPQNNEKQHMELRVGSELSVKHGHRRNGEMFPARSALHETAFSESR